MTNTTIVKWEKVKRWIARNIVWLVALCMLIIFRGAVVEWIIEHIEPITCSVVGDSWWVLVTLCVGVVLCYIAAYKRLQTQHESWVPRCERLIFLFIAYLIIRLSPELYLYGIDGWVMSYTDCAWICVIAIEMYLYSKRKARQKERLRKIQASGTEPFFVDVPTVKDEMDREQYAIQLVNKIHAGTDGEGAFAILLNEHFGTGKTSFMLQLEEKAKEKGIAVCWFKPWLYDNTKALLENYMRILQEMLGDNDWVLRKMLDRYVKVLSPIDRYRIAQYITYDDISTETQLSEIKEKLRTKRYPIIMMIDDIDRLQSDELLSLLQLVRNIADFPYVYYIIAGDKEALQNRLKEKKIQEPDEYLKKFFNFEICFPADDTQLMKIAEQGIKEVFKRYDKSAEGVLRFIRQLKYKTEIFANIRDVKRYLNVLDYTLVNFQAHGILDDVYMRDVAGICMIQCIDSEFYKILRDHNEYILEYKNWHLEVQSHFSDVFKNRSDKKMLDDMARAHTPSSQRPVGQIEKELEEKVKSISDLVQWSKPTKMEIIGELLGILFPRTTVAPSKTCVCHPTEYFKYFSTTYKGTEMSNAEAIGIMRSRDANFKEMVRNIMQTGRIEAFRHKMEWYMQTQKYDRLSALDLVLDAFDVEWEGDKHKSEDHKNEWFKMYYGSALLALFQLRQFEKKDTAGKEWDKIVSWLISTSQYERRILIFAILKSDIPNHDAYIFDNPDAIKQCIHASEKQYVANVWSKAKYKPGVYRYIKQFMEIDDAISNYVTDAVKAMKQREVFFYHLTALTADGLQWNNDFIDCVIGSSKVFDFVDTSWSMLVPDKWVKEFLRFDMKQKIKAEDIRKSDFLTNAVKYWGKPRAKTQKEVRDKS